MSLSTYMTLDQEFEDLLIAISCDPIGQKMLTLSGISLDKIDMGLQSHNYFQHNWQEEKIDHNANSNNIGPINYSLEVSKPPMKLIGLYLLHRYLRKDHSVEEADRLIKNILYGTYYFHDASGVGIQIPYSYDGAEVVTIRHRGTIHNMSIASLYEMLKGESLYEENGAVWYNPIGLEVLDQGEWVAVTHLMKKVNTRKMIEVSLADGSHQLITDNHPMITTEGEVDAGDLSLRDTLETLTPYWNSTLKTFRDFDLDGDLGYLIGIFVGEGWTYDDGIHRVAYISQKPETEISEKIETILDRLSIKWHRAKSQESKIVSTSRRLFDLLTMSKLGANAKDKSLPYYWPEAPKEFLVGMIAGIIDAEGSLGGVSRNIPQIRMTGRSTILQLRQILTVLGCSSSVTASGPYNRDGSYKGNNRIYSITLKMSNEILSAVKEHSVKMYGVEQISSRGQHKLAETGIVSVRKLVEHPVDVDYVYDMTTETGTFTCNGIHSHNCYAYSTFWIMTNGIPWGQLKSLPPKRARSFIAQVAEVTMDLSQDFAGAIAPADVIMAYSYYAKKEGLKRKEIENDFQSLVHILNKQFRPGGQSPFTNISCFDKVSAEKLFGDMVMPDGSKLDIEYAMKIQDIVLSWICQGDPISKGPYRFPITTTNVTKDDHNNVIDREYLYEVCEKNLKYGNLNIHIAEGAKMASCCRLINDPERMRQFKTDTFGNGGLNIGSHRVININLPRQALASEGNWDKFYTGLSQAMDDVKELLICHREKILKKRIDQGFLKVFTYGMASMGQFFSTIGFEGVPDALDFMGATDHHVRMERELEIMEFMENRCIQYSKETGYAFNLEEVPGEGAAVSMCSKDKILFEGQVDRDLYSNQFVPLTEDMHLLERIRVVGQCQDVVSGGSILHLNMKERFTNPELMMSLIEYAVKMGVTHMAINYGDSICENGHWSPGMTKFCKHCDGEIVDNLTRVVGYFVPVSSWNPTRQLEFKKRFWGGEDNYVARK